MTYSTPPLLPPPPTASPPYATFDSLHDTLKPLAPVMEPAHNHQPDSHYRPQHPPSFPPDPPFPPPQDSRDNHTFAALLDGIYMHPFFALVVKNVFEACGDRGVATGPARDHYANLGDRANGLRMYAESYGLDGACERWTSTDVFMSALVTALAQVKDRGMSGGNGDPVFQETLAAGERLVVAARNAPGHVVDDVAIASSPHGIDKGRPPHYSSSSARRKLSETAKTALEIWFQEHLNNPYPTLAQKAELSRACSLSLASVNNWFGNKRMRLKRKMLSIGQDDDEDGGDLGSTPSPRRREAINIHKTVLAPKSKWNALVLSKMDSPAGRNVIASATSKATGAAAAGGLLSISQRAHDLRSMSGPLGAQPARQPLPLPAIGSSYPATGNTTGAGGVPLQHAMASGRQ